MPVGFICLRKKVSEVLEIPHEPFGMLFICPNMFRLLLTNDLTEPVLEEALKLVCTILTFNVHCTVG